MVLFFLLTLIYMLVPGFVETQIGGGAAESQGGRHAVNKQTAKAITHPDEARIDHE